MASRGLNVARENGCDSQPDPLWWSRSHARTRRTAACRRRRSLCRRATPSVWRGPLGVAAQRPVEGLSLSAGAARVGREGVTLAIGPMRPLPHTIYRRGYLVLNCECLSKTRRSTPVAHRIGLLPVENALAQRTGFASNRTQQGGTSRPCIDASLFHSSFRTRTAGTTTPGMVRPRFSEAPYNRPKNTDFEELRAPGSDAF